MTNTKKNKMLYLIFKWILVFFAVLPGNAQIIENFELSDHLKEISGLELLNDSTLIAFNDGGNKSELYLLNLEGKILRTIDVEDTKNSDWEDIAIDDTHIYIGDIGNNQNNRENLSIVKIKIADVLKDDVVEAETIKIKYAEQSSYPPKNDSLFFDAEGMTVYNDSIWIFTKDRSQPFKGVSYVYKIPTKPGNYTVWHSHQIPIGTEGWLKDGITAADVYGNHFYLLTYNRYIEFEYSGGTFKKVFEFIFDSISQRESIVVLNKETIFVADESHPIIGGVKMYKIHSKK